MDGFRADEIVGEILEPHDFRELDEPSFRHVERRHGGRQQSGALTRKHSLQQQAGIIEGGARGHTQLFRGILHREMPRRGLKRPERVQWRQPVTDHLVCLI